MNETETSDDSKTCFETKMVPSGSSNKTVLRKCPKKFQRKSSRPLEKVLIERNPQEIIH